MCGESSTTAIHSGCVILDLPGFSRHEELAFHPCPLPKLQLLSTSAAEENRSHQILSCLSDHKRDENEN